MDEDEKLGTFHALVACTALAVLAGGVLGGIYLLAKGLQWVVGVFT